MPENPPFHFDDVEGATLLQSEGAIKIPACGSAKLLKLACGTGRLRRFAKWSSSCTTCSPHTPELCAGRIGQPIAVCLL